MEKSVSMSANGKPTSVDFNQAEYLAGVFPSRQNTGTDHVVCDCTNSIQAVTLPVSYNRNLHFLQSLWER